MAARQISAVVPAGRGIIQFPRWSSPAQQLVVDLQQLRSVRAAGEAPPRPTALSGSTMSTSDSPLTTSIKLPRGDQHHAGREADRSFSAEEQAHILKRRAEGGEDHQGKSFIASSASTPPVMEIGTKGAFDAI